MIFKCLEFDNEFEFHLTIGNDRDHLPTYFKKYFMF